MAPPRNDDLLTGNPVPAGRLNGWLGENNRSEAMLVPQAEMAGPHAVRGNVGRVGEGAHSPLLREDAGAGSMGLACPAG